jgi:hypothetical protein
MEERPSDICFLPSDSQVGATLSVGMVSEAASATLARASTMPTHTMQRRSFDGGFNLSPWRTVRRHGLSPVFGGNERAGTAPALTYR